MAFHRLPWPPLHEASDGPRPHPAELSRPARHTNVPARSICRRGKYPGIRYNLACSQAPDSCSDPEKREALATQAMDALRQAMDADKQCREPASDDDLDPPQELDFQALRPRCEGGPPKYRNDPIESQPLFGVARCLPASVTQSGPGRSKRSASGVPAGPCDHFCRLFATMQWK